MDNPATLAAIATEFEADASVSNSANATPAGYWLRIALAAEELAGGASSANANQLGYMLRAAIAMDTVCGTDGSTSFNINEPGYIARIVAALEAYNEETYEGSLEHRLFLAITDFSSGPTPAEIIQAELDAEFSGGRKGAALFPWMPNSLYQEAELTTPALNTDAVGGIRDLSGNNSHASATGSAKPQRIDAGGIVDLWFDGTDDQMFATIASALKPNWTMIAVVDRGLNDAVSALCQLSANSGANDFAHFRAQTSERIATRISALSQSLSAATTPATSTGTFPQGSRTLLTMLIRPDTGNLGLRVNGSSESTVASNWPAALSLGSSITWTLLGGGAGYPLGRFCGGLTIDKLLTGDRLAYWEGVLASNNGITL